MDEYATNDAALRPRGMKKRQKSLFGKVRLNRRGSRRNKMYSDFDFRDDCSSVVEYSLEAYHQKAKESADHWNDRAPSRRDGEANEEDRSQSLTKEGVEHSFFNDPFGWMYSHSFGQDENDCDEIDGYQADQERDQALDAIENEDSSEREKPGRTRRQRKRCDERRKRTTERPEDASDENGIESRLSLRRLPSRLNRSDGLLSRSSQSFSKSTRNLASRSSRALSSGATTVTTASSKIAKKSSKAVAKSARKSSKAVVTGAKRASRASSRTMVRSSRAFVEGAKKVSRTSGDFAHRSSLAIAHGASRTSRALATSVQRMIKANQKRAASMLLASVHGMIHKSSQSPRQLLTLIYSAIQDAEAKAATNRRIACRQRRKVYKNTLYREQEAKNDFQGEIGIIPELSEDPEEEEEEDCYRCTSSRSFFSSDCSYDSDSQAERSDSCCSDSDDVSSDAYDWETNECSDTEDYSTDLLYGSRTSSSSSSSSDVETDEMGWIRSEGDYGEAETDDDFFDSELDDRLSPSNRAMMNRIDSRLKQLEGVHELERSSSLYRLFFPED